MIFRYYPEIHFSPIFEIQIYEKKFLTPKKFHFNVARKKVDEQNAKGTHESLLTA